MKIVFMGTPDYSVKTLEALKSAGHEIIGVFAQPDKPVGRKHILTAPPTKEWAISNNIAVFQPETLRDGQALEVLKQLNPEIIVVVAYGKILPKEILDFPKYGCVNGHASLLPKLRGASPIQWSIVSGEKITGVTTMLMDVGMDTGDILLQQEVEIGDEETADELFERLSFVSADLTVKTVEKLSLGEITPIKQNEEDATYAPIIKKDMALLDFSKDAAEIVNAVRGYYSWPCAYFILNGKRIKVIKAKVTCGKICDTSVVIQSKDKLVIACGNNTAVELEMVQPEGKSIMSAQDMLRGNGIPVGTKV